MMNEFIEMKTKKKKTQEKRIIKETDDRNREGEEIASVR